MDDIETVSNSLTGCTYFNSGTITRDSGRQNEVCYCIHN